MKFIIKKPAKENVYALLRKLGYRFQGKDEETLELIFVRRLERDDYPRFHLYLKENSETQEITFNLHLDQRRTVYNGTVAHFADYEGPLVQKEAKRIKEILGK